MVSESPVSCWLFPFGRGISLLLRLRFSQFPQVFLTSVFDEPTRQLELTWFAMALKGLPPLLDRDLGFSVLEILLTGIAEPNNVGVKAWAIAGDAALTGDLFLEPLILFLGLSLFLRPLALAIILLLKKC